MDYGEGVKFMKEAKRPHKKPDLVIYAFGVVNVQWKERIVSDFERYYHLDPENWSYYKNEQWFKINEMFMGQHGNIIKDSYASWALERELL